MRNFEYAICFLLGGCAGFFAGYALGIFDQKWGKR